jgi:hypothetical protein
LRKRPFHGRMRVIVACILSFTAMAIPFYHAEYYLYWHPSVQSSYYWSFRFSTTEYEVNDAIGQIIRRYSLHDPFYIEYPKHVVEAFSCPGFYFDDIWLDPAFNLYGLSSLLVTIFVMQVWTLTTEIASIFVRTRIIRPVTNLSGAAIIGLMLYWSTNSRFEYSGSFELGFWFSVLAEIAIVISLF